MRNFSNIFTLNPLKQYRSLYLHESVIGMAAITEPNSALTLLDNHCLPKYSFTGTQNEKS